MSLNIEKDKLEKEFGSEEAIGIEYRDYQTEKLLSEMTPEEEEESEIYAFLPDGTEMGRCTNCANYIQSLYPERTDVYGFLVEDNPKVSHPHVIPAGGHDFAVVDGRYIVDPWISSYTCAEKQTVYDMESKDDRKKIIEIYGKPEYWSYKKENTFIKPYSDDYPTEKRIRYPILKKQLEGQGITPSCGGM